MAYLNVTECMPGVVLFSGNCKLILSQPLERNTVYYAVKSSFEDEHLTKQLVALLTRAVQQVFVPAGVKQGLLTSTDLKKHQQSHWNESQLDSLTMVGINPLTIKGGTLVVWGQSFRDCNNHKSVIFNNGLPNVNFQEFHPDFKAIMRNVVDATQQAVACALCGSTALRVRRVFAQLEHGAQDHWHFEASPASLTCNLQSTVQPAVAGLRYECDACGSNAVVSLQQTNGQIVVCNEEQHRPK